MSNFFDSLNPKASKYTKTQFDMSYKEEWTLDLIDILETLYLNGYQRSSIKKFLGDELKFTIRNANMLLSHVESQMYKNGTKLKNNMLEQNLLRLQHIYNSAMKQENYNLALKTIDLLNKTANVYTNNINVEQTAFTFQLGTNETVALPETIEIQEAEIIEENEVVDDK